MATIKPNLRLTETYSESNFLRLYTAADAADESCRRVTLEHLSYRPGGDSDGSGWRCQTIVDDEAMSRDDALFIARTYAEHNDVPVIYECHAD